MCHDLLSTDDVLLESEWFKAVYQNKGINQKHTTVEVHCIMINIPQSTLNKYVIDDI